MTTVTLTEARAHLGKLCERVGKGEEIGIIVGNQILQLQPVEVRPAHLGEITIIPMDGDHVMREYGLTAQAWRNFQKREKVRHACDKQAGRIVSFKGTFNPSRLD
jgi:antitoxin (DNA-binding transcriptional repressor) of toxin-antitoxin stability system